MPKYKLIYMQHTADNFGTLKVSRRDTPLFNTIMSREDALELAVDLGGVKWEETITDNRHGGNNGFERKEQEPMPEGQSNCKCE